VSEAEENKSLVRNLFEEVWSKGSMAAADDFVATDYVDHSIPSGLPPSTKGLKQEITTYHTAFRDVKATLEDIFAEGEPQIFTL
jgi:hypothetical protein